MVKPWKITPFSLPFRPRKLPKETFLHRREFISATIAAASLAGASAPAQTPSGQTPASKPHEFYQLRKYLLRSGPQTKLADTFFGEALIPALNRLGITPVGAFRLEFGPETPTTYLLLPSPDLETLATLDLRLAADEQFMKAAGPFWSAPAAEPAFVRLESALLRSFDGWPRIVLPRQTAAKAKRIFQLRTYESPTCGAHVRKVEMFHSGEFEIFAKSGIQQVFYGDALVGPRLPHLTYMLAFSDIDELNSKWDAFRNNPDWKKLSASSRFAYEAIVSNIDNQLLTPAPYSQI